MNIEITDADYEAAFARDCLNAKEQWARVKARARQAAADRLLHANMARQRELLAEMKAMGDTKTGPERLRWLEIQELLTGLFAEHDKLMDAAFGPTTHTVTP